jgi:Domain of unknown function (DUF4965)/Domain of unknown function (DUF5127)/Domain of unknown function (DUF1793)/Domain of unknown function (DUF4964)
MRLLATAVFLTLSLWAQAPSFRPPAVPLIVHDPYFSVWSMADHLTDENTKHWTGTEQPLTSLVRVDGQAFQIMGHDRHTTAVMTQKNVQVLPTRTIYRFEGSGVGVELTFLTPAIASDLEVLSRPVTYIIWTIHSTDGREHQVEVYFDASAALAVNTSDQPVVWGRFHIGGMNALRVGTQQQPVLEKDGDNLRIDWGYFYLATPPRINATEAAANLSVMRAAFLKSGQVDSTDETETGRALNTRDSAGPPAGLAVAIPFGAVGATPVSRHVLVAYDDIWAFTYLQRRVRAWWRRNGATAGDLLTEAERDFSSIADRSAKFDADLISDLRKAGGDHFAQMAALAYRQSIGAHKMAADADGKLLFFPKENFSNGCIDTVDVFYPSSPLFLLLNPKLLIASVEPLLEYASMPRWGFDFAPHDLGRYPHADGQVYGGGEKTEENQMPVEESSNMIILTAAIARSNGDTSLARRYWPVLSKWAGYLKQKGLDPENQLSTDDFAGHLAHNANLSIKAILALGAYAQLAESVGRHEEAASYRALAQQFVDQWITMAGAGDHYALAFDQKDTWSQKYNLIWGQVLGLDLFPAEVKRREIAFYLASQNAYGLPLDNRSKYTKLDWIYWTASLAESPKDFNALIEPTWKFANESPSRVPLTDWYWTQDAKQRGFQARSVVGGLYMKMLTDAVLWKKWVSAHY